LDLAVISLGSEQADKHRINVKTKKNERVKDSLFNNLFIIHILCLPKNHKNKNTHKAKYSIIIKIDISKT